MWTVSVLFALSWVRCSGVVPRRHGSPPRAPRSAAQPAGRRSAAPMALRSAARGRPADGPDDVAPGGRVALGGRVAAGGRRLCGRRDVFAAGAALVVLPGLAAAAPVDDGAWWGSEGILSWVSIDTYSQKAPPDAAENARIYTVEFVTYLSRFLLNFDASCAKWWRKRLEAVPQSYGPAQRRALEAKSFAAFAASVEYGLRRYPGADGPCELLASLARQHGFDVERRRHLALAFSFLGPAQPRAGIAQLLVGVDEVKSASGGRVET